MTWYVTGGTQINCAETGAWLSRHGTDWRRGGEGDTVGRGWHDFAAHAMLAALGYRWDGHAIVPVAANGPEPELQDAPKPAGLTLEPVDLSKPREAGRYWIRLPDGKMTWLCVSTPGRWSEYGPVTRAYRLPEELP